MAQHQENNCEFNSFKVYLNAYITDQIVKTVTNLKIML